MTSSTELTKKTKAKAPEKIKESALNVDEAPNPVWFKPVMFGFMLLGLVWIVVYYITSQNLGLPIPALHNWNLAIGFGLILIGFGMTTKWR